MRSTSAPRPIVVRALPVTRPNEVENSTKLDNSDESFAARWRNLRYRFDISSEKELSCSLCSDPAIPFAVITPCGHVACQDCAEDSSRCPKCDRPILARTIVLQMMPVVLKTTTFRCLTSNCFFSCVGDVQAASAHRCGVDARGDPLLQQVLDALALEKSELIRPKILLHVLSCYRQESTPVPPFVLQQILDHLVVESATAKTVSARKSQRYLGPKEVIRTGVKQRNAENPTLRRAYLYWDYASICPRKYGVSPSAFLDDLIDIFQRNYTVCFGDVTCVIYLPWRAGGDSDETELREMGCALRFLGDVTEDEERIFRTCEALDGDLQKLIENNLRENVTMVDAVLLTTEANFNAAKGILRESGMHVHVVHDSSTCDDEIQLASGSTSAIDVKLMPTVKRILTSEVGKNDDSDLIYEGRVRYIPPSTRGDDWSCEDERYL